MKNIKTTLPLLLLFLVCTGFICKVGPSKMVNEDSRMTPELGMLPLKVDLSRHVPPSLKEDKAGSLCVPYATCIYTLGTQRAASLGITDRNEILNRLALSPMYAAASLPSDCGRGFKLEEIADFLVRHGGISYNAKESTICRDYKKPAKDTDLYRIKAVIGVFRNQEPAKELKVKQLLAASKPVMVGFTMDKDFKNLTKLNPVYRPNPVTGDGAHSATVVGYDDEKKRFKFINSFGPEWGENGFFYMTYDNFKKHALQAIVLELFPEK